VTAPVHFDPRIQIRSSGNERLQIEPNALVEADAWRRIAGGVSGEVGGPGDAIGRLDQSHRSYAIRGNPYRGLAMYARTAPRIIPALASYQLTPVVKK
jgi:hypothetical protein